MLVTPDGIFADVNPLHPQNAFAPILSHSTELSLAPPCRQDTASAQFSACHRECRQMTHRPCCLNQRKSPSSRRTAKTQNHLCSSHSTGSLPMSDDNTSKRSATYARHSRRNHYSRQCNAIPKRIISNDFHACRNRHRCQPNANAKR